MTIYKNILSTEIFPGCPDSLWRENNNLSASLISRILNFDIISAPILTVWKYDSAET